MVTAGAGDMGQEEAEVQDRTAQELQSQSEQGVTVRHQAVRERSVEGARPTPHKNPVRPFLFQTKKRSQLPKGTQLVFGRARIQPTSSSSFHVLRRRNFPL